MKYFVQFKEDTTLSSRIPTPGVFELVEATRPYLDNLKKLEKVTDWGFFGTGHGLYAFFNVKNAAELHEFTELLPVRQICQIQTETVLEPSEFSDVWSKIKKEGLAQWDRLTKTTTANNGNRPNQY